MRNGRYQWLSPALGIAVVLLVITVSWFFWQLSWLRVQVAFAEEQIEIFDAMRAPSLTAESPARAAGFLDYTVNYYPSGSKQDTGSQLDTIVERNRALAIRDIVADLRQKTGEDLGDDPQTWTKKYAGK
jgi:hypothetical protein